MKFKLHITNDHLTKYNLAHTVAIENRNKCWTLIVTLLSSLMIIFIILSVWEMYIVYRKMQCDCYLNLNISTSYAGLSLAAFVLIAIIQKRTFESPALEAEGEYLTADIALEDDCIFLKYDHMTSNIKYSAITSIKDDGNCLYVYTSPYRALIFPSNQLPQGAKQLLEEKSGKKTSAIKMKGNRKSNGILSFLVALAVAVYTLSIDGTVIKSPLPAFFENYNIFR